MKKFKTLIIRLALLAAIAVPLWFAAAGLGSRAGLWTWGFGLGTMTREWAIYVCAISLGLGILAFLAAQFIKPRKTFPYIVALLAIGFPLAAKFHADNVFKSARTLPFIHDVSTDPQDPPRFTKAILTQRAKVKNVNAANYIGKKDPRGTQLVAVLQAGGYPDIAPMISEDSPALAYEKSIDAVKALGWDLVTEDIEGGVIEATDTTFWYGFKDDIIIRIRSNEESGSVIDMRSLSRIGGSDLGKNASRIRDFKSAIKADFDESRRIVPAPLDIKSEAKGEASNTVKTMPVIPINVNDIAGEFVKMALAFGPHDKNYVDAYTGKPELQTFVENNPQTLEQIEAKAANLLTRLGKAKPTGAEVARVEFLKGDIVALQTRLAMLRGETFTFDEETRLIYGAVAPQFNVSDFDAAIAKVEALKTAGYDSDSFLIPADKVKVVMDAAIAECRARTKAHYELPEGESFDMEFVNDKPWSAYNWYKGDFVSLIEVNTDLSMPIGNAIDLGCHEGYPGHHVFNVLAERDRIKAKGWIEGTVVPLYSPAGPIMEGSGNYGVTLAFPGEEKIKFERDVLYPLAGLNPALAEQADAMAQAKDGLAFVPIHAAREYLDGRWTRDEAATFLVKYNSDSPKRAQQRVDFFDTYRGYTINYALGQKVIGDYIDRKTAQGEDPWDTFKYILDTPLTVSDLQEN